MGMTRDEWCVASELAITELAQAAGVEIDPVRTPGLHAMACMVRERQSWWDYERTRAQREQDQRNADTRRLNEEFAARRQADAERAAAVAAAQGFRPLVGRTR